LKIRYTRKALAQLDEIFRFIEARNPDAALAVRWHIIRAIGRLARFPLSSRQTDITGVRVLPITRYRYNVFYAVDEAAREVHILRIRHSARDPAHLD
jgi:plasmid stabilization system protein ParE